MTQHVRWNPLAQISHAGPGDWVSLADRCLGLHIKRGREDELSGVVAGTCQLDLDDDDGELDPENSAGAFYPAVDIRRSVAVQTFNVPPDFEPSIYEFVGNLDAIETVPHPNGATASLKATDAFKLLQRQRISGTLALGSESVGDRVQEMLDVGYSGSVDLDTGSLTVPALNLTDSVPLDHVNDLMIAERGQFFVARDGIPTFRERNARAGSSSLGTFGAGGNYPIKSVRPIFSDGGMFNDVRVTRTGQATMDAIDTDSTARYGTLSYSLTGAAADCLPDQTAAQDWADALVAERAFPYARIGSIVIDPEAVDTLAFWTLVLNAELGDKITLMHDVVGTLGITSRDAYIESIAIDVQFGPDSSQNGDCLVTWGLSMPADLSYWFILDSATQGVLDFSRLGF